MNVISNTHIGLIRQENQDKVFAAKLSDDVSLAIICDGMGGESFGSMASSLAIDTIIERITSGYKSHFDENAIRNLLISAVFAANAIIFETAKNDESKTGMGTTCVIALVVNKTIHIVNIGDSRGYILTDGQLNQITNDHTVVKMLYDKGKIQECELKTHSKRNLLTKAVGVEFNISPDYFEFQIQSDSYIILCSDGLTNFCSDAEIQSTIHDNSLNSASDKLIEIALGNGGRDNISLAIIEINNTGVE